jgi:large subunit ribosomal protein L4
MQALLDRFGIKSALLVAESDDRSVRLSAKNIPKVSVVPEGGLNVYDLLKFDFLVIKESHITSLEQRLKP